MRFRFPYSYFPRSSTLEKSLERFRSTHLESRRFHSELLIIYLTGVLGFLESWAPDTDI